MRATPHLMCVLFVHTQTIASLGPAACLFKLATDTSTGSASLEEAAIMVTAWLALGGFSSAGYGSNHADISGKYAGILYGLSNGLASIAASVSPWQPIFFFFLFTHWT